MEKLPEYFIGLVSQYTGALNSEQAERYARSVIEAWYFSLDQEAQKKLRETLPKYLTSSRRVFQSVLKPKLNPDQDAIFSTRLMHQLLITDQYEVRQITAGVFKSLKIVSSQTDKFAYSRLISGRSLQKIYIGS